MKQMARSFSLLLLCHRVCLLVYVMLAIITFSLAEVNKHDRSKVMHMKERSDAIKSSEKLALSPNQREDDKVNT